MCEASLTASKDRGIEAALTCVCEQIRLSPWVRLFDGQPWVYSSTSKGDVCAQPSKLLSCQDEQRAARYQ